MKIRAIIFDLDNTLIDFVRFKNACIKAAVDAMISEGLGISKKEAINMVFELYKEYGWDNQKIFDKFLKKTKGLVDYKLLATAITAYRREKTKYMKPYPNVIPTLKKLKSKGIKLAILSDAPRLQAYIRLADLGLLDYFDPIVTLEDTGKRKPHPAPFKKILSELKLKPQEVLMVGDAPQWDIKGAKQVGMKTALAMYGLVDHANAKKIRADYEISDIKELVNLET